MEYKIVYVGDILVVNDKLFILFVGMNVLELCDLVM